MTPSILSPYNLSPQTRVNPQASALNALDPNSAPLCWPKRCESSPARSAVDDSHILRNLRLCTGDEVTVSTIKPSSGLDPHLSLRASASLPRDPVESYVAASIILHVLHIGSKSLSLKDQ